MSPKSVFVGVTLGYAQCGRTTLAPLRRRDGNLGLMVQVTSRHIADLADMGSAAEKGEKPFLVYFNHSLMHMPTVPREEFKGKTGQGPRADSLFELDTDFGALLDLIKDVGVERNTIVVFAGDNGPEVALLWRGSSGYWEGSYFAGGEGNLRTPCMIRCPGHIAPGSVSDEIMHITDWFTTLTHATGAAIPSDRVIDGKDQLTWLTGRSTQSAREGYVYWMGLEIYGVKGG